MNEIKGKPGFVRPTPIKAPEYRWNANKYCDYHSDKGHDTYECYHLKKLIEKMIREGNLKQFIQDLRDKLSSRKERGKEAEERDKYRGEVKTISGGSTSGKDSKTAKKRYARQVYNLYQYNSAK